MDHEQRLALFRSEIIVAQISNAAVKPFAAVLLFIAINFPKNPSK